MTIPSISVKSPLHADHLALDAEFTARGIGSAVAYYGEQHAEQFNEQLSILDLSCINRIGFKGVQTCTWLEQQGVTLPQTPNSATVLPAGQIMLRLSSTEHWVLDSVTKDSDLCGQLRDSHNRSDVKSYLLERNHSHACFYIVSEPGSTSAAETMSKICAVDLRPHRFANLAMAQTSVARLNAVVVRHDHLGRLAYLILSDMTAAQFMWHSVLDAMQEFDGRPAGLNAITLEAK
ncbi:MAG TPA: hypothetical protein DCW52_13110 [Gammaproteobacteria bacterium]|jgi:sarcosine oxidase subunit gamma|nr:hypothetical protein [Gammaproteobacteria bacterium]